MVFRDDGRETDVIVFVIIVNKQLLYIQSFQCIVEALLHGTVSMVSKSRISCPVTEF